jgi:MarR family transcriptional regulator, lower aerobic nicotinate degradation pathway regulator
MNDSTTQINQNNLDIMSGFELSEFVPYLLNQAMSQLDNNLRHALKPFGLSIHQWRVLFMLNLRGSVSIGDISAATVMGQSTITRVADQLEEAGLARRARMPDHKRVILLSLTKAGIDLIEDVIPVAFDIHNGAVEGFNKDEQQVLFTMLQKLASNFRRHEARQKMNDFTPNTTDTHALAG